MIFLQKKYCQFDRWACNERNEKSVRQTSLVFANANPS